MTDTSLGRGQLHIVAVAASQPGIILGRQLHGDVLKGHPHGRQQLRVSDNPVFRVAHSEVSHARGGGVLPGPYSFFPTPLQGLRRELSGFKSPVSAGGGSVNELFFSAVNAGQERLSSAVQEQQTPPQPRGPSHALKSNRISRNIVYRQYIDKERHPVVAVHREVRNQQGVFKHHLGEHEREVNYCARVV